MPSYAHLLILLILPQIISCGSAKGTTGVPDTKWYSKNPNAPYYVISTADELAGLAEIVNGTWGGEPKQDPFLGKIFMLAGNIDLTVYNNWMPIGAHRKDEDEDNARNFFSICTTTPFAGTFDGGGYVISNLTINRPESGIQGLFGNICGGKVENLGLENINITGGNFVGGIVGMLVGGKVINSYSTGKVSGERAIGGVVGILAWVPSSVMNSYSTCTVSGKFEVGGIAGDVLHGNSLTNCYAAGAVIGGLTVGGIVGHIEDDSSKVINCAALNPYVKSSESSNADVGRIAGYIDYYDADLSNNVASAAMEVTTVDAMWRAERGADKKDGIEITAQEIMADGTIGGRFTSVNGWTTKNGKLPGLLGKTRDIPEHLMKPAIAMDTTKPLQFNIIAGTFKDQRDGKEYRTVKIGDRVWMAENLNFKSDASHCYKNDESYCKKYGRLYNWETAFKSCPAGWRLSTDEDWEDLIRIAGGDKVASQRLRAKHGWDNYKGKSTNGTDDLGFSALPAGICGVSKDNCFNTGKSTYWWGSKKDKWYRSWCMRHESRSISASGSSGGESLNSVRCVRK